MKTQKIKYAPLALAVAALFAAPLAFAQQRDFKQSTATNNSFDVSSTENTTKVVIDKKVKYVQDVNVKGNVVVRGVINIDSSSTALVDDKQINYKNSVENSKVKNSAKIDDNVLRDARGNIGVNVTAGDNNQQANAAALSSSDARFLFGSVDAEIFARQDVQSNWVGNRDVKNDASLEDNVLRNASGNIGVNVSAGSNNQQKNDLAASVGRASMATATVAAKQMNDHNRTRNHNTANTASIGDNVLRNASGNIGVNVAAGTNNQQFNGLALAVTR